MKQLYKFSSVAFIALLGFGNIGNSQAQDISELVKFGPADATKLAQAYLSPALKGFGYGMNSGWYNSAKAKKLGRFDLKIQATGAFIPTKDQSFNLSSLGLSDKVDFTPNAMSPTIFGKSEEGPEVTLLDNNGNEISSFNMPEGTGFNIAPSPQIELTVGLIKNTDVTIRYSPEIKIEDTGSVQTLGFGVKHEITKYLFPGKIDKIIPFDIALAFGYNQLKADYKIAVSEQLNEKDNSASRPDLNQRLSVKFSGYTFDAILSKKLAIFTPFVSVGYNTAKSELGVLGSYVARTAGPTVTDPQATNDDKFTTFVDPVQINQKDISGLRANVGFALHLLIFRIYGAYSIGQYQAVTAGIGLGIGK